MGRLMHVIGLPHAYHTLRVVKACDLEGAELEWGMAGDVVARPVDTTHLLE